MVERGGGGKEKAEAEVVAQVSLRDNYEHKKSSSEIIMSVQKLSSEIRMNTNRYSSLMKCF